MNNILPKGFYTHSKDINNHVICLGDVLDYDFEGDDPCPFEIVFEDNAFRKKYKKWDESMIKPILEIGVQITKMRIKIIKKWNQ